MKRLLLGFRVPLRQALSRSIVTTPVELIIAPDSIKGVTVVTMEGIKLVLELIESLNLVGTASNKTNNRVLERAEGTCRGDTTE